MSAYKNDLHVDSNTHGVRLELAASLLQDGKAAVVLDGQLALRPFGHQLLCEVITQIPEALREASAFRAEIEAAQCLLEASTVKRVLPALPLEWIVVEDYGTGTVELWSSNLVSNDAKPGSRQDAAR